MTTFYRLWAPPWWHIYKWLVLGPEMKHALLVHAEVENLRYSRHRAQYWNCLGKCGQHNDGLDVGKRWHRMMIAGMLTPFKHQSMYEAFRWNHNLSELHYRSGEEKAKQIEGMDPNGIAYDEARRELYLDFVHNQVILPRGNRVPGFRVIYSSTPLMDNYTFMQLVQQGIEGAPDWHHKQGSIEENTFLDPEAVDLIRRNLDPRVVGQVMRGEFVQPPDAFFVAEAVLSSFAGGPPSVDISSYEGKAQEGHRYVAGADQAVSEGGDESVVTVWDITKLHEGVPAECVYHFALERGTDTGGLLDLLDLVSDEFKCQIACDGNGPLGVELAHQAHRRAASWCVLLKYGGLHTSTTQKKIGVQSSIGKIEALTLFRFFVNSRLWTAPNVPKLKSQILGYKLKDANMQTDHLMANVNAAQLAQHYLPATAQQALAFPDGKWYQGHAGTFGARKGEENLSELQRKWMQMVRNTR
jgi:hypothetical protein